MNDAPAPPIEPPAGAGGFQVGDRVKIEGELRRHGEEGHLIRVEAPSGMLQYVWVKLKHIFRA